MTIFHVRKRDVNYNIQQIGLICLLICITKKLKPMLHQGMIIVGVPYSVPELTESGSPYGPSRIVGRLANKEIEVADIKVTRALGRRVAEKAQKFVSQ
jgi:multimeric flavodoxin WrbA